MSVDMTDIKHGKTLSWDEFKVVLREIDFAHRFGGLSKYKNTNTCKNIKYIRPNIDMRTKDIFNISFDNKKFDFRESDEPMFVRIIDWLNEPR